MLTVEMMMVMAVIAVTVFLFVVEWVRVDVVAIIVMVSLPILGLVSANDAFVGFSSNAVISIIAVIIIGAGLDRTGIMNKVTKPIATIAGNSESRLIVLVSGTVAVISSFMQNIGAVALFLPATKRICKAMNMPPSRILMPMGFMGIIGGCLTLVGSSPLILLNDLIAVKNLEPFGLFDVTPIGAALVIAGLLYFVIFGRFVLPSGGDVSESDAAETFGKRYPTAEGMYELIVPPDFESTKNLEEMGLRPQYFISLIAIAKQNNKVKLFAPTRTQKLEPGDTVAVIGAHRGVKAFAHDYGLAITGELDVFKEDLAPANAGMVESIIPPRSYLEGKTLRELHFREKYQVVPLVIKRGSRVYFGGLSDIALQEGDVILLQGLWEKLAVLHKTSDFSFITPMETDIPRTRKATMAAVSFGIALTLVITGYVSLAVALMTGATLMILTKVLTVDEAYSAVDWRTVFLLAGLIPLGIATETSGTAQYIATQVLNFVGDVSPIFLLTVIGVLTSMFTLVVSNVGATVLLVPLAINMAIVGGADPRMAALTVAVAASNTFILPTHQVNAYIMGPGGYKTVDYLRAGSIMTILYLIVMIGTMYLLYGIS